MYNKSRSIGIGGLSNNLMSIFYWRVWEKTAIANKSMIQIPSLAFGTIISQYVFIEELDPSLLLKSEELKTIFIIQTIQMSEECSPPTQAIRSMQGIQINHIGHHGRSSIVHQKKDMFQNQVCPQVVFPKISDYCRGLRENKIIKSFKFQVESKSYIFEKILPMQIIKHSLQDSIQKAYVIPSEIFTIISPVFLNALESYIEPHPSYRQERETYADHKFHKNRIQITEKKNSQIVQIQPFSALQQQFITQFLQRHTQTDQLLKQLVYSVLRFNYFNVIDISNNKILLEQLDKQTKLKYSSFYQLYLNGNNQVKRYIISQIIGQKSYIGFYSQLYKTPFIQIPFCIKYEGKYVAMVYIRRLNQEEYFKKLKITKLKDQLKQKGHQEIIYIYTLFVLPKYKGMGHGSHILNILKLSELPLVLCSSSSTQLSGLTDSVGNSYFYKKCQFEEYYPLEVSQEEDQLDCGCLFQTGQHKQCSPNKCLFPKNAYLDQSYYVFMPQPK